MKKKLYNVECKALDKPNTIAATFSTSDVDRHGDMVLQNWDLSQFVKNPVILNSHNSFDASEVIGKAVQIGVKDNKLEGEIEFAVDANPKAKVIYDLYAGGFLKAFSVGFIPKQMDDNGIITYSELLEISAVSVPANAMALAKAKGIDVDALGDTEVEEEKEVETTEETTETVETTESTEEVVETDAQNDQGDTENKETIETSTTEEDNQEEVQSTDEDVDIEPEAKLLNAVQALRKEYQGRNFAEEQKNKIKTIINRTIKDLIKDKKSL